MKRKLLPASPALCTCGCTYDAFVVINAGKPGLKCKGKGGCQSSQKGWKANDLGVKSC